jgi:DNA-binding XRE family transcriptional regulator/mannose-6-phosphate isomerase-like protein (cupin superfamily)
MDEKNRDQQPLTPVDSQTGVDGVLSSIGPKLRQLRTGKRLSFQRLAEQSGVSAAAIHKIEHDGMVPTVTTLLKIAAALNRPVSYFTDEAHSEPSDTVVMTPASRRSLMVTSKAGIGLHRMSGPYGKFFLATALAVIEPLADSGEMPMSHPGEELIYLLEGSLELEMDGATFRLCPGDALHFRTDRPHRWRNPNPEAAEALWMMLQGT